MMEERDEAFEKWINEQEFKHAYSTQRIAFYGAWNIQQKRIDELEKALSKIEKHPYSVSDSTDMREMARAALNEKPK